MRNLKMMMMIGYAKIVGIPWDDNGEDHWIICDLWGSKFHLQCSGIQYRTSHYWTLDLDNIYFECDECK